MTAPAPLWGRCGLDVEHEPHPRADGAQCDGKVGPPAAAGADPDGPPPNLAAVLAVAPAPHPWALPSLPAAIADELADQLVAFVAYLNEMHAVQVPHLILGCWPLHPGLVADLASLYSGWVDGHEGLAASAERGMYWHDRWLPNFYARLPGHFGKVPDACTPGAHRDDWNPAAAQLAKARKAPDAADARAAIAALRTNPAYLETT